MTGTARVPTAVVLAASLLAGCTLGGSEEMIVVSAAFDSAVGVYETGEVRVLDQRVGEIRSVELLDDRVVVELAIRGDVPLPADVQAVIEAQTVLGERSIALFPAWTEEDTVAGMPRLADGDLIPLERTDVPVEPDQALQSINELLSSLDSTAVGGLVSDGAEILDGRGARIGEGIGAVAALTDTLVAVDGPMLEAARSLDRIASSLTERDGQLRSLIQDFGQAVGVLADERESIQTFLASVNGLTAQASDLLDRHADGLPATLAALVATLDVVEVNAATIPILTENLPIVAESFEAAYKPEIGGFFLKVNTLAVVETVLFQLLDAVGLSPRPI